MITISVRWTGTDGKTRWKISRRIDDTSPFYKVRDDMLPPFLQHDAFDDAHKIADYCMRQYEWCNGVRIKHNGKIIREETWN